ncbi:MAG: (d)CMP kinase [Bacilli bacterium]|nr:(d)CMP kinase [Bacilli bacterium]
MKVVAIDGPAGSGKGTVSALVKEKCNLVYIDTGATYRCVALASLRGNVDITNEDKIIEISKNIKIEFSFDGKVYLNGEDVTEEIRGKDVTQIVSPISSIVGVRKNMVELQRKMAFNYDVIMEGRDITTIVFPNANYKFYLDADVEVRAQRRYKEMQEKNIKMTYEEVLENIKERDYNDMNKKIGALKRTDEQIYIDTTNMTIDEVVDKIVSIVGVD